MITKEKTCKRLACLKEKHAELKRTISRLEQSSLVISKHWLQGIKKQKLQIKDEISRLEGELVHAV
ncbi:MAG: YdcH family protein [Candidatus Pacebacteria bacterium]|nr:YdcH family protein [Candidatus Paceibacterota bacterium]